MTEILLKYELLLILFRLMAYEDLTRLQSSLYENISKRIRYGEAEDFELQYYCKNRKC
jgi:hypothetical protein